MRPVEPKQSVEDQETRAAALLSDGPATLVERHGGELADTMRLLQPY